MNRRAEISFPMEYLIQLVLIAFVFVALMSFAGRLSDHTVFHHKMLAKELPLIASSAFASPSAAYVMVQRKDIPMDLYTFEFDGQNARVARQGDTLEYPFGTVEGFTGGLHRGGVAVHNLETQKSSHRSAPSPMPQFCPGAKPLSSEIVLDAGHDVVVDQKVAGALISKIVDDIPASMLGLVKNRQVDLKKSVQERISNTPAEKLIISIQVHKATKPRIVYDVQGKYKDQAARIACLLSNDVNTARTIVPAVPINLDFVPDDDPQQIIKDKEAIQIIVPENLDLLVSGSPDENRNRLAQSVWSSLITYLLGGPSI